MAEINFVYLQLGSNIEPREKYINSAIELISRHIGEVGISSSVYESEALGFNADMDFYNQVICCNTTLSAFVLLERILLIEEELGRIRTKGGYTSRTIDIDILYFNNDIINEENLTIPHPRIQERRFVLTPLCEIADGYIHPVFKKRNSQLLKECIDNSKVERKDDK